MWISFQRRLRNLRRLWGGREHDQQVNDEIRFHIAQEMQLRIERGESERAAMAAARQHFGSIALAVEDVRAVWIPLWLDQGLQDVRIAVRMLSRAPRTPPPRF
jgi:hypothetical protein